MPMVLDKKMQEALAADGDKLRALTGKEHGPMYYIECAVCGEFWFSREPPECDGVCPECGCELEPES